MYALMQISWNHENWTKFVENCNCINKSGYDYVKKYKIAHEWWNFNFDKKFPNKKNGRIHGFAPFRCIRRTLQYINNHQGKGIIFFISSDLHNTGRKIVGIYGKAKLHGIELKKYPNKSSYWGLQWKKFPNNYAATLGYGSSIYFSKYKARMLSYNINSTIDANFPNNLKKHAPIPCLISGELESSTNFNPKNYLIMKDILLKDEIRVKRSNHFPSFISKCSAENILQRALEKHKKTNDKEIINKLNNLIKYVR